MMGVQGQCDGERDNEGQRDTDAMKSREYTIVRATKGRFTLKKKTKQEMHFRNGERESGEERRGMRAGECRRGRKGKDLRHREQGVSRSQTASFSLFSSHCKSPERGRKTLAQSQNARCKEVRAHVAARARRLVEAWSAVQNRDGVGGRGTMVKVCELGDLTDANGGCPEREEEMRSQLLV